MDTAICTVLPDQLILVTVFVWLIENAVHRNLDSPTQICSIAGTQDMGMGSPLGREVVASVMQVTDHISKQWKQVLTRADFLQGLELGAIRASEVSGCEILVLVLVVEAVDKVRRVWLLRLPSGKSDFNVVSRALAPDVVDDFAEIVYETPVTANFVAQGVGGLRGSDRGAG